MTTPADVPGDATRSVPDDLLLGRLALEQRLVSGAHLAEAIREQEEARRRGGELPLGQILLARGRIQVDDLTRLLHEQARRSEGLPSLPRYEFKERIGQGASAVVHRAWDRELRRVVAIKIQKETNAVDELARHRFRREAQAAGALAHPNVVTLFDAGEQDGQLYLVMEFVEGRPLSELLRDPARDLKALAELIEKAARGVAAAHARGIVHRDLKPANILVGAGNEPKVGDFGLAHVNDSSMELTKTGATLGTPLYMAPEQVQGRTKDISPATDVYALGAILYEAAAGRPPFGGETLMEIYGRVVCEEPVPPHRLKADVPPPLETILLRALEKDPARRYADAGALADDLRRFREGAPIRAKPPGLPILAARWMRRHRTATAVALTALSAGMALLVVLLVQASMRARERADRIAAHLKGGALARVEMGALPGERERLHREAVGHYRSVLELEPGHGGAKRALADVYFDSFDRAEKDRDRRGMEVYRELTLFFDDGRYAPRMVPTGFLTVESDPPGADVDLLKPDVEQPERLGPAPLGPLRLPVGKYLLTFRKAGFPELPRAVRVDWGETAAVKAELWSVPQGRMKEVFEEARTPHKHGLVLPVEAGTEADVPSVFRHGDRWLMFYTIARLAAGTYETRLAESLDLRTWKPVGPILAPSTSGWDSKAAIGTPALMDPAWGGSATLLRHEGRYWMSYLGTVTKARLGVNAVGMAWAEDPAGPWTRAVDTPVLTADTSPGGDWEAKTLVKATVVRDGAGASGFAFLMYYEGEQREGTGRRIGIAGSHDLLRWHRIPGNPVIDHGGGMSGRAQIVRMGDAWVMFYFGAFWKPKAYNTFACSYDLLRWTRWEGAFLLEPSQPVDYLYAHKPWLIKHAGVVHHFYCAVGTQGRGIALATSTP